MPQLSNCAAKRRAGFGGTDVDNKLVANDPYARSASVDPSAAGGETSDLHRIPREINISR